MANGNKKRNGRATTARLAAHTAQPTRTAVEQVRAARRPVADIEQDSPPPPPQVRREQPKPDDRDDGWTTTASSHADEDDGDGWGEPDGPYDEDDEDDELDDDADEADPDDEPDEDGGDFGDEDDLDEEDLADDADEETAALEEYSAESYLAGQFIPLPSGKKIRVRPISLVSAVRQAEDEERQKVPLKQRVGIPNGLLPAAKRLLYEGKTGAESVRNRIDARKGRRAGDSSVRPSQAQTRKDNLAVIDWLVCQAVASFKVVNKPQHLCRPSEVSIARIFESDKEAIADYCMRGQAALKSFRRQ